MKSLPDLILSDSSAKCFDDRDKVWALSALTTNLKIERPVENAFQASGMAMLDIEYSTGATELYLETARALMRLNSRSKLLLLVYSGIRLTGQPSTHGLLSWVSELQCSSFLFRRVFFPTGVLIVPACTTGIRMYHSSQQPP